MTSTKSELDLEDAVAMCDMLASYEFEFTVENVRHVLAIWPDATDAECWRELSNWLRGMVRDGSEG